MLPTVVWIVLPPLLVLPFFLVHEGGELLPEASIEVFSESPLHANVPVEDPRYPRPEITLTIHCDHL